MAEIGAYIGWVSSFILLVTLLIQLRKQWKSKDAQGVSVYLFSGQSLAQVGFVIYSYLIDNQVFLFTNSVLLIVSIAGFILTLKQKRA